MEPVTAVATAPWWAPAAIAGGASLLGSIGSSAFGASSANKQMGFQERMSSTAHQREVLDLKKAGLNPILSARLGGSSTPPGAQGQVPDFGNSAKTGLDGLRLAADMGVQKATIRDINAAADLKDTQRIDITNTQQSRIMQALAAAQASLSSGELSAQQARVAQQTVKNLIGQLNSINLQNQSSALDMEEKRRSSEFWKGPFGKLGAHKKALGVIGLASGAGSSASSWQDQTLGWAGEFLDRQLRKGGVIK